MKRTVPVIWRPFHGIVNFLVLAAACVGLFAPLGCQNHGICPVEDHAARSAHVRSIMVMHTQTQEGGRIDGWVNGKFIEPRRSIHVTVGRHEVNLQANESGLTGNINGRPVDCQNLILDVETGELKTNDPGLFERIGNDFEFEISIHPGDTAEGT